MDNTFPELRILILEDVPADAEPEVMELRAAGIALSFQCVAARAEFERALAEFKPDIVLSDYNLPAYNGRDALIYSRTNYPQLPVIMVTGAMGDEQAVELLKLGAADYVLKSRLVALPSAVRRAIAEQQALNDRERTAQALAESEEKFRTMAASAPDAIIQTDNEGRISYWNATAEKTFGYPAQEAIGQPLHDLLVPARFRVDAKKGFAHFEQTGTGPAVGKTTELIALRKDATEFPVELSISAIQKGKEWHAVGIVRDITAHKAAEAALLRTNRSLKTLSEGNMALVRATGEQDLLQELTRILVQTGGYRFAQISYAEHDAAKTVTPMAFSSADGMPALPRSLTWADNEDGQLPISRVIRCRKTVISQDILQDPALARWHDVARANRLHSVAALPLFEGENILGGLAIFSGDVHAFDAAEIRLLEELTADLCYGIRAARTRAKVERHAELLRQSLEQFIGVIAGTLEARDPYTAGHQRRVADLAVAIARELQLPAQQIEGIRLAGLIHDLGKIQIPAELLAKPTRLTSVEFMLIQTHSRAGYDILKDVEFPWPIADIVLQHHEKLDGSGYPQSLKGDEIRFESRIMTVADVVEAMSSHRPYRPALGIEPALDEITKNRGRLYDAEVVDACLKLFREKGFQFSG